MDCNPIDDQHQGPTLTNTAKLTGRPPSISSSNSVKYDDVIDRGRPVNFSVPGRTVPFPPSPRSSFPTTSEDPGCLSEIRDVTRKRKRSRSVSGTADCEPLCTVGRGAQIAERGRTRLRSSSRNHSEGSPARATSSDRNCDDPIQCWTQTGSWPRNFAQMSRERGLSPKKQLRISSYPQSVQDGGTSRAFRPAFGKTLAASGIHMEVLTGTELVKQESRDLCTTMLLTTSEEPQYAMFPLTSFPKVWQRAYNRNKARIFRDITPLLVPSPELLFVNGHAELEHVVEELNTEWIMCKPIAGLRPKPYLAIGISYFAFTTEEMAKLDNCGSIERPTQFTDNMYFPFLLCEVKSGDQALNRADRQNMHSGSVACQAILELERSAGENRIQQLSGEILVYSVSHNNENVKIFGHFAVIRGEQTTFHRFPIASFDLRFEEAQGRKRTHDFVRELYRTVFPKHLRRVQDALKEMSDPGHQTELESIVEESLSSM